MPFSNEVTYVKFSESNRLKEFDTLYEKACEESKKFIGKEYPNLVNGEIFEKAKLNHISPVDEKSIGTFQAGSKESADKALEVLKKGQKKWFNIGHVERARIFLKAADLISRDKFLISALLALENGKNRTEAMADVDEGIDFLRYYALNLIENNGFVRFTGKGYKNEESMSYMKPYGVFAVIAPFNFYAITVGMVAGPLIVGNSVLLKPSSDIPLTSYLYVKTLYEAGVPKENLAFISGKGSELGPHITSHKLVSGILFTGSRNAGMSIYRNANSENPKVVITEMGGKDTITVTKKADLEKAANGVYRAAFGYSGQKCSACSIAYIESSVYDVFLKKLKEKTDSLVVGDPMRAETFLGPVINKDAVEKYKEATEIATKEGKVVSGGEILHKPGNYVKPTIVTDLPRNSMIIKEELFLPFLAVVKVQTLDEAIERINESEYGLTGGIFTEDQNEIEKFFDSVEVGTVYANRERGGSTGAMVGSQPFVGWKMSGISGKGTGSFYYLQQFLREQSQTIAH